MVCIQYCFLVCAYTRRRCVCVTIVFMCVCVCVCVCVCGCVCVCVCVCGCVCVCVCVLCVCVCRVCRVCVCVCVCRVCVCCVCACVCVQLNQAKLFFIYERKKTVRGGCVTQVNFNLARFHCTLQPHPITSNGKFARMQLTAGNYAVVLARLP